MSQQPTPMVAQPPSLLNPQEVDTEHFGAAQTIALHRPPTLPATTVAKITTAICRVMANVGVIQKAGTNEFFHYKFVQMQDVLQTLTPLMAEAGIAVLQTEVKRELDDNGKALAVTYAFTICHNSGEVWPERMMWTGSSIARNRNGTWDDKALNKCATAARKYCLLSLFQVPTGDVDDADRGENDGGAAANERNPRPAPNSQAIYDALRNELGELEASGLSPEGLKGFAVNHTDRIQQLSTTHYDAFRNFYVQMRDRLIAKAKQPDSPIVQEIEALKREDKEALEPEEIADLLENK